MERRWIKDNNVFVFSLDNKKKYNIKQPEHAIGFDKDNFWLFGWSYVGNETCDIQEKYELNGGERNFTVKSFEIFLVES